MVNIWWGFKNISHLVTFVIHLDLKEVKCVGEREDLQQNANSNRSLPGNFFQRRFLQIANIPITYLLCPPGFSQVNLFY